MLECSGAFLLCLTLMVWIQFAGPAIIGNDAYYHIRWSTILRESAPHLPAFTWLPLTVLRAPVFVDQHFLFHVILMPFTLRRPENRRQTCGSAFFCIRDGLCLWAAGRLSRSVIAGYGCSLSLRVQKRFYTGCP